ncbi:MAG: hypothetical protein ABEI31_10380 [Halodesulfurarchaeum sp.]
MDADSNAAPMGPARRYGGVIAIVSGVYSLLRGSGGAMSGPDWVMLLLGVVVLVHGVVLFTPAVRRLGSVSGPLMIGYAVVMLANQAWMATMSTPPMGDSMGMGGSAPMGPGYDLGMVAIAVIMLASGVLMTADLD